MKNGLKIKGTRTKNYMILLHKHKYKNKYKDVAIFFEQHYV